MQVSGPRTLAPPAAAAYAVLHPGRNFRSEALLSSPDAKSCKMRMHGLGLQPGTGTRPQVADDPVLGDTSAGALASENKHLLDQRYSLYHTQNS